MKAAVLESDKYPKIIFIPKQVSGKLEDSGEFRASLSGNLILHGVEHPLVLGVRGRVIGNDLTATTHFSIPYVAWGLKDPSILFLTVATQVEIDVTATGHIVWDSEATHQAE